MAVIEIDIQDFLPLGHSDIHRPTAHTANQWLSLTQLAKTHITVSSPEHLFALQQVVSLQRSIVNLAVSDYLSMGQQGARTAAVESMISIFFMWHEARVIEFEQLTQLLTLVQTVVVDSAKGTSSDFEMTDTATCAAVRSRSIANTFLMASAASGYLRKKDIYSINLPTLTGPNTPEC